MAQGVMVYAGFWRRCMALLIDLLLMLPVYLLLREAGLGPYVADAVNLALICVLYCLFLASRWQATPGMRAMRVKAVDETHAPIGKGKAAIWCVASVVGVMLVFAPVLRVKPSPETQAITHKVLEVTMAGQAPETAFDGYTAEQVEAYAMYNERLRQMFPVTLLLGFVWAGTVVVGKQKAGLHNWLVGMRFLKGRA